VRHNQGIFEKGEKARHPPGPQNTTFQKTHTPTILKNRPSFLSGLGALKRTRKKGLVA